MTVADELSRRVELWEQISAGDAANAEPTALRSMRVYGGAQGIWVDKMTTAPLSRDGQGVTVSILHTGRHYLPIRRWADLSLPNHSQAP